MLLEAFSTRNRISSSLAVIVGVLLLLSGSGAASTCLNGCQHSGDRMVNHISSHSMCGCCGNGPAPQAKSCRDIGAKHKADLGNQFIVSTSNGEGPVLDSAPVFVYPAPLSYVRTDGPKTTPGSPIIYLTNLNLLC